MTQPNEIEAFDTGMDPNTGQPPAQATGGLSLKRVHSMMRGRYLLAATLFLVGAAIGGPLGYKLVKPEYTSTGALRVKSTLPKVFERDSDAGTSSGMGPFDQFLESQVKYLKHEVTISLAMDNPNWKKFKRPAGPDATVEFTKDLVVNHLPGSEWITVSFTDKDADAARAAVRAVIDTYVARYGDTEYATANDKVIAELQSQRDRFEADYAGLRKLISDAYREASTTNLDRLADSKGLEWSKAMERRRQIEEAINMQELMGGTTRPSTTKPTVTPESLAKVDKAMSELLAERDSLERERRGLSLRMGPQSRPMLENERRIADVDDRIQSRFEALKATPEVATMVPADGTIPLDKLQLMLKDAVVRESEASGASKAFVDKIQTIRDAQERMSMVSERLREVKNRQEEIQLQSRLGSRLEIPSYGDQPLTPTLDARKKVAGGLAFALGMLGAGLVALRAYLDPRVRHIADAEQPTLGAPRVLGVVPAMLATEDDPDRITSTAHSVHNVRVQLQMEVNPEGPRCIVMTSPAPGSGKTSLTMALGVSFAATGSRTLLIDCDPTGGGLTAMTRRINRRRIGRILVQQGIITEEQLDAALDEAARTGKKVGEVIEESGLADSATIAKALQAQAASMQGLRQALRGEDLSHCIVDAGVPDLYVLTLGDMARHHAGRISPGAMKALFERAKQEFDTVLVDTGPILGGLESMMAASMADGVVVALSSGEHKPLVQRAFDSLTQARVNLVGVVFNRAKTYDLMTSTFSSSVVRHSVARLPAPNPVTSKRRVVETEGVSLGPIGSAVATINDRDEEDA